MSADDLIQEHLKIGDQLKAASKWFEEQCKPFKVRLQEIQNELMAQLNAQNADSFRCEHGTAYKSNILNLKVEDREQLLDFCNEHWDEIGGELLLISAQKDACKRWMEETGKPPPGVSTSWFVNLNIRRS